MNGWSIGADARAWGRARAHAQYSAQRPMFASTPSYSKNAYYETNQGPKSGMTKRVAAQGHRYSGMTALSSNREFGENRASSASLPGPGQYSPPLTAHAAYRRLHIRQPGTSAFCCGLPRTALPLLANTRSEPGYASLANDGRAWTRAGARAPQSQRFQRPPGAGSNLPSQKISPGPGAYGSDRPWPEEGVIGTSRGFNHNR